MFPVFDHVVGYPLVFAIFWGAAAIFALAMARHLRVFAAARPAIEQPRPFGDIGRRLVGLVEYALVQRKMFKDPRAGLMHAGIFWGFVLLTIGTANIVTGGIIQTVLSAPFNGLLWTAIAAMQNVVAVIVLLSILWAFERRLISRPKRLTFNRDALVILSLIGGVVGTELLAQAFEFARFGDQPGAFVAAGLAVPLRAALSPEALKAAFTSLWCSISSSQRCSKSFFTSFEVTLLRAPRKNRCALTSERSATSSASRWVMFMRTSSKSGASMSKIISRLTEVGCLPKSRARCSASCLR